ncbi:hypothetical protein CYMTET_47347 [Cymbomonas tetramitiformis]|uniref:BRCT domain-containing protein n=1 Tax=Cymbomonas tetramitiformis TaxID=36881 RepID=A0AAE0BW68_9CHLO|nr:hypothetical protein CYMTET_47347 [Cymbomonas tetramitiformis]
MDQLGNLFHDLSFAIVRHGLIEGEFEEATTLVLRHGGKVVGEDYTYSCTHVLLVKCAENIIRHVGALGKQIVTEHWLYACIQQQKIVSTFIPGFESLTLCFTGYQSDRREDLRDMVWAAGARWSGKLTTSVTHLVAYTFDGPKYTYAANRPNQQVVNHMWLEDSLMNWAKQDENNYKRSGQEVDAIANAEVKPVSVPPKVSPFEGQVQPAQRAAAENAPPGVPQAAGAGEEAPSNGPPTVWHAAPTSEQLARPRVSTVASPDWSQLKRDGAAVVWSARSNLDPTLQVRTGAVEERADFVGLCPNSPSDLEREVFGRASEIPAPWPVFQGDVQRASSAIPVCPKEFAKLIWSGQRPRCDAGRLKSVLGGHRQFELLEGPPHKSEGSRIRVLSLRKRGYLAALRDASEDSLASWKEAAASAASALSHRNVQRAVQCQFDLEIAKQAPLADAVLETFCTAYLPCAVAITDPFKSILKVSGMLKAPGQRIELPSRPANTLPDVKLKPVKYTLLQLVENFHEFLGGRFPPLCSQEERARSSEQGAAHASPRAPLVAEMGSGAPPGLKEGCEVVAGRESTQHVSADARVERTPPLASPPAPIWADDQDETAMPTLPEIDDDETQVEEEWRSAPSSPQRPAVGNSPSNAVHVATHTAALERSPDTGITGAGVRSSGQPRQRTASLSPRRLMCDTDLHHELGAGLPHGQPGEAAPMAETEARGEALLEEIVSPKLPRCSGEAVLSSGEAVASPGVYDCETQRETETVPCSLQERYDSGALPGAALEGEQGPGIVTCEDPGGNEVGPRDNDGGAEETEVEGYDTHMTGSGSTPAKPVEVAADDVRTPWAFGAAPAVETPAVETQEMAAETPSAAWSNMPLRVLNDELVKTVVRGAKASECPRGNAAFNDDDDAMQAMVDCAAPRRHKSPVPRKVTAQAAELPVPDADKENSEADVATYQHAGSTAQAGMAVAMSEATSPEWMVLGRHAVRAEDPCPPLKVSSTAQKKGVPVEEVESPAKQKPKGARAPAQQAPAMAHGCSQFPARGAAHAAPAGGEPPAKRKRGRPKTRARLEPEEGTPQAEPTAQGAAAAGAEVASPVQRASGRVTRMGTARAGGREAEEGSPQAEPAAQEAAAAGAEVASPVQRASGRVTRMGTVRAGGREAEEGSPQAEPAAQEAAAAGAEVASPVQRASGRVTRMGTARAGGREAEEGSPQAEPAAQEAAAAGAEVASPVQRASGRVTRMGTVRAGGREAEEGSPQAEPAAQEAAAAGAEVASPAEPAAQEAAAAGGGGQPGCRGERIEGQEGWHRVSGGRGRQKRGPHRAAAQRHAAGEREVASPVRKARGRVTRKGTAWSGGREAEEGSPQAEPAAQEAAAAGAEVASPVRKARGRVTRMGLAGRGGRGAAAEELREQGRKEGEKGCAQQESLTPGDGLPPAEVDLPVRKAHRGPTNQTVREVGSSAVQDAPVLRHASSSEEVTPSGRRQREAPRAWWTSEQAQAHIPEAGSDAVPEGGAQSVRTARTSALPPERGSPAPVRKRVRAALDDDDAPEEVAAGPADALGEQDKQQAELEARVRKKGRGSRRVDALDQPTGRPGCETEHHMNSVRAVQHNEEEEADVALEESCEYAAGDEQDRLHGGHDGVEAHCMDAQDGGGELPAGPAGELESTRNASRTRRVPLAGAMEEPRAGSLSRGGLAVVVALSGMHREEQRARGAAVRKLGWELCTGHEWDPRTTHVVFGGSGSRGEKFLAGAAAGALLVNEAYLEESARSHVAVVPRPELLWDGGRGRECGLIEEGVAHHWQAWREVMGSGPFHGMKIVLFGAFPTRAALMRTITAGGGTPITASPTTSASSQTALGRMVAANELAFAIEDPARPLSSTWVKRLLAAKVSCLSPDFIIDWIARPHMDLQVHLLHGTSLPPALKDAAISRGAMPCRAGGREEI